jgi:hypothetical protein
MPSGLLSIPQEDFAGGSIQSVARHLIAANGAFEITNGLLDDDGSVYLRGGSSFISNAAFGASLRWIWDGYFTAGRRTVFASPTAFGVLAADEQTPVSLGGGGLSEPVSAAQVGGILFIGGGTMYAGSRMAADYSTGTIDAADDSTVVTGTGTTWLANVDPGMLLRVAGAGRYYVVASVDSNTQITLTEPVAGAIVAQAYALTRLGTAVNHGAKTASIYASLADRLVAVIDDSVWFSEGIDADVLPARFRTHSFIDTALTPSPENRVRLPEGERGVAAAALDDRLMVFSTGGVWVLTNVGYGLVDDVGQPLQRLQRISGDLIGWGAPGLASWENSLVVAAADGVYMMTPSGGPQSLTRGIRQRYLDYVRQGFKPGTPAVFRSHLFLPVLDASNDVMDLLVCRLDRTVRTREGDVYPWTFMEGHGGNVTALTVRASSGSARLPRLLAADRSEGARVLELSSFFTPGETFKLEADASVHNLTLETRDYRTGDPRRRNRCTVRHMALFYELLGDGPLLTLEVSDGRAPDQTTGGGVWGENWDEFDWATNDSAQYEPVVGAAPVSDGRAPFVFRINRHTVYIRYRLKSSGVIRKLVIRSLESFTRQSEKPF